MNRSSKIVTILCQNFCCCGVICGLSILGVLFGNYVFEEAACEDKILDLLETAEILLSEANSYYFNKKMELKSISYVSKPRDCSDVMAQGHDVSGIYTIWPTVTNKSLRVYCDMDVDGGWTVIQRRGKFPVQQRFDVDWHSYKTGFGDITKDFWLGNDNIYALSNQGPCEIRFDLEDIQGNRRFAVYKDFRIDDESRSYTLHIGNYSGDAGDSMRYHDRKRFATKDRDHHSFAAQFQGGWWVFYWPFSNLNGLYLPGVDDQRSVHWYIWLEDIGLANVEMKLRLRSF
ncbi:techylectin-5A [Caerostris darwini]|uniref:Techylectin-5A n=1 Tax=Caerostris darwini TaxID=1538125 RepID=A0AAV4NP17_9ARAC|nr:techylectin-5A [Caerostris darwini]